MLIKCSTAGPLRQFPDATASPIVGMNVDTLYSIAHLNLSQEPLG